MFNVSSPISRSTREFDAVNREAPLASLAIKPLLACIFEGGSSLKERIKTIPSEELLQLIKRIFKEGLEAHILDNPLETLEKLMAAIPEEALEALESEEAISLLEDARSMFEEAKYYADLHEEKGSSLKSFLKRALEMIVTIIDSLVKAFGIGDFFKPAESEMHADFKSQKIMMLLSMFSMLATVVLPLTGAAEGAAIIGSILLAIVALSLVWPFIKPAPTSLPGNAENWTLESIKSKTVFQGRKESLDAIADILKMKRHALLVGPSRVGKSLTAKAFAKAIERGDYPFLEGKTVFRINTADLIGHQASFLGGGNNILNKISEAMGRYRGDIILVLDEVHMACKEGEKLADQLKPFLDENGDFVHVIGITTQDEYRRHVRENNAFALRFDCVAISNTSKEETVQLLADQALTSTARPLLAEGVLDFIVETDHDDAAPQPATALKRLKRCIVRIEKGQLPARDEKTMALSREIAALRSKSLIAAGSLEGSRSEMVKLKRKLKERETKVAKKRAAAERLYREKETYTLLKEDFYQAALKIGPLAEGNIGPAERSNITRLSLMRRFLLPAYFSYLERKSKELKVPLVIDNQLVLDVLASDNR